MNESNFEDRAAIHDLFTRYCCALDNGEIEAVVDCFTVDAILKSPVIDISGRDEIRAFAQEDLTGGAGRCLPKERACPTLLFGLSPHSPDDAVNLRTFATIRG